MRTRNLKLKGGTNGNRFTSTTGIIFFTVGVCITLIALFYMLVNLDKSDSILPIWILFLVGGLLIVFAGIIINYLKNSKKDKPKREDQRILA